MNSREGKPLFSYMGQLSCSLQCNAWLKRQDIDNCIKDIRRSRFSLQFVKQLEISSAGILMFPKIARQKYMFDVATCLKRREK